MTVRVQLETEIERVHRSGLDYSNRERESKGRREVKKCKTPGLESDSTKNHANEVAQLQEA